MAKIQNIHTLVEEAKNAVFHLKPTAENFETTKSTIRMMLNNIYYAASDQRVLDYGTPQKPISIEKLTEKW